MPQFSTNETVSLERGVELSTQLVVSKSEDIDSLYEINKCADWIKTNNFEKVCLQFPDYLLPDSSDVVFRLQSILNQTIYILGDTAYESCCIDYIAAAHINADAIIHFGPICFSKTSANIPYLYIFEKYDLNVGDLLAAFCEKFQHHTEEISLLVDSPYIYRIDDITSSFVQFPIVNIKRVDEDPLILSKDTVIFVGKCDRKLTNIKLSYKPCDLLYFDDALKCYEVDSRLLKRRYFLIEKIKDSETIGIIIGTLGVKNYLDVIDRLKKLIDLSKKKYYLISVGKPTVAKLANFPEIDIYVVVTCSLSEIYDSREFYKPIATPYDLEMALNTNIDGGLTFSLDYNRLLGENFDTQNLRCNSEGDVSLLTNKVRSVISEESVSADNGAQSIQIAVKNEGTVAVNTSYGAGYLADRSWKGLEQDLGKTEAQKAKEGRSGIAQQYKNEQSSMD